MRNINAKIEVAALAIGFGLVLVSLWMANATAQDDNQIIVHVSQVKSAKGEIGCALYDKPKGFPNDIKKAVRLANSKISAGKAVCTFGDMKPGEYAISVMHDEDSNGELNTKIFGIPTEGWGVSNNAPARRMGPPKYEKAKFQYEGGQKKLAIRLRY